MISWMKNIVKAYREQISYLFFGGLTSLVSWSTYAGFVLLNCGVNGSNVLSWITTTLFAYVMNKLFVFRCPGWSWKQVLREVTTFISARLFSGAIEIASVPVLLYLGVTQTVFGIEGFAAKFLAGIFPLILNYFMSKKAVFLRKERRE